MLFLKFFYLFLKSVLFRGISGFLVHFESNKELKLLAAGKMRPVLHKTFIEWEFFSQGLKR
jgi:hypothetical protein